MVDLEELVRRINKIKSGELPDEAVTEEELREALNQHRMRFQTVPQGDSTPKKRASTKKKSSATAIPLIDMGDLFK